MIQRATALVLLITVATWLSSAAPAAALELAAPDDPLRSSLALSFGIHSLDDQHFVDYFDSPELKVWSLRYDIRTWRFLRVGLAISAGDKQQRVEEISLGSESYPIRYSFTAFQATGEIYLRSELPRFKSIRPHLSIGRLFNRLHVESSGWAKGYDGFWEENSPATELRAGSEGWRFAVGLQMHFWANINMFVEFSSVDLDPYLEPVALNPPVNEWDLSGKRLEFGLMQRF